MLREPSVTSGAFIKCCFQTHERETRTTSSGLTAYGIEGGSQENPPGYLSVTEQPASAAGCWRHCCGKTWENLPATTVISLAGASGLPCKCFNENTPPAQQ